MKQSKLQQKSPKAPTREQEQQFMERLRQHPQMWERFQSILELTCDATGPLKTFDEMEDLLVQEIRQLGNQSARQWASQAEERVSQELQAKDPSVCSRKKRSLKWWCIFGQVEVRDRVWRSATQSYIRPLPERIGITPRGRSRRLHRVLTDFGIEQSFAKAAWSVEEHYGFAIGASAVRNSTLEHAARAKQRLTADYDKPFRALPAEAAARVIAEADGTLICTVEPGRRDEKRPRSWEEMRLVAAQDQNQATAIYAATFGSVADAGARWGHCARDAGWGLNSLIHSVGDGASWVCGQTREVFGKQGQFLCDFYHVSEYLAEAALICRPSHPDAWRHTQQDRLKRGAAQKVVTALAEHLEPAQTDEEEAPVRSAHRYLTNRLDSLDYPQAIALDLPIGSGMIESGHKHVLQARLKKPGAAWLRVHADQMGHLRVLRANQQWASLWN